MNDPSFYRCLTRMETMNPNEAFGALESVPKFHGIYPNGMAVQAVSLIWVWRDIQVLYNRIIESDTETSASPMSPFVCHAMPGTLTLNIQREKWYETYTTVTILSDDIARASHCIEARLSSICRAGACQVEFLCCGLKNSEMHASS